MGKWLRVLGLIAIGSALFVALFWHEQDKLEILSIVAACVLVVIGTSIHSGTRNFFAAHVKGLFVIGLSIAVATPISFIGLASLFDWSPGGRYEHLTTILLVGALIIGAMLMSLPTSFRNSARIAQNPIPIHSQNASFNGLQAAGVALLGPLQNIRLFFQLSFPWILIISIVPHLTLAAVLAMQGKPFFFFQPANAQTDYAVRLLGDRLPNLVLLALAVSSFAVAWHRRTLSDPRGRTLFAWPNTAAWSYLWRLVLLTMLWATFVRTVVSNNSVSVAHALGTTDVVAVTASLLFATIVLFLAGASSYALVLPAIAIGDSKISNMQGALIASRTIRNWYAFGFVLASLPYILLKLYVSDLLYKVFGEQETPITFAVGWGLQMLFFMGVASATAYLSLAYARALNHQTEMAEVATLSV